MSEKRSAPAGPGGAWSRPAPLGSLDQASLTAARTAIFLDFDGTLAEIVDRPEAAAITPAVHSTLVRLQRATGGATAIVTGRTIREIDGFLEPLRMPVAGVHGLERRGTDGEIVTAPIDAAVLKVLHERLARLADAEPGLLLEVKTGSIALHYRRRPDLERNCLEAVEKAIADLHGLETLRGKMVVEIKAGRSNKGDAIADFMKETPFRGRVPIFAGDDVTDEDAFREIARLNGIAIKIGSGDTSAGYRARGTAQFHQWLNDMASAFDSGRRAG